MIRQLNSFSPGKFDLLEHISGGSSSQVYRAIDNDTGQSVAIKKILNLNLFQQGIPSILLRQISNLKNLNHPQIVTLQKVLPIEEKVYLVFEYLQNSLDSLLHQDLPETSIKRLMLQLLEGVNYCHSKRYIHRDLKPENILIDRNLNLKIADFGISRQISHRNTLYTQEVQTLWYRAPQVLLTQGEYGLAIDVWSIGCIFAELVLKRPLFAGTSPISQIFQICKVLGTPSTVVWPVVQTLQIPVFHPLPLRNLFTELSPQGLDLIQKMLVLDPNERITCKSALKHPFFNDLDN